MVKVIYGEYSKQLDLAGKSVADVREMYDSEFSLSDRAQANLNGQWLKKKQEAETKICDEDELYFEERSKRGLVMLGTFLLALALTGGLFAYTQTTLSSTITVTAGGADFANVAANTTPDYTILGKLRGTISTAMLYSVNVTSGYTGDIVVNVYLSNADDLEKDYSSWMMRLQLTDVSGNPIDTLASTDIISLDKTFASFEVDTGANLTVPGYIECDGGSFKAFSSGWLSGENPIIFAQVIQAGDH